MLAFKTHATLFTIITAAQNIDTAHSIVEQKYQQTIHTTQWHTPDIWTRRAVDMAKAPGIIDTIPRFVVDRKDGPVYLDIDDVPAKMSNAEINKCMQDSPEHLVWLHMLRLGHSYNEELREHIAALSRSRGDKRVEALIVRALAGAWGLGPIPEWHAAILPALIALDIETTDCVNAFGDDVFEMDRAELITELGRCASFTESIPKWIDGMMRGIAMALAANVEPTALRELTKSILVCLEWLQ